MVWLCVELPNLGLEVFSRGVDHQTPTPLVLIEANRVVIRNAAAIEAGIRLGATLATARSVCHGVRHFVRDARAEQERLRLLAEACYRYGPGVSLHAPDALLLDIGPSLRLFRGLYRLKRNLVQLLADAGHSARIGIASTPLAALAFARAGVAGPLSAWPTPDELDTHTRDGLKHIPLGATELDADSRERFANMGIERLGQVLGLPRTELGRRFGMGLLTYLERLVGNRGDPREFIAPRETFTSALHLLESISNKQALAFPMQRLASELGHWLVSHQLGATALHWGFTPLRGRPVTLDVAFAEAQQHNRALLDISRLKLESSELPEEVMSIVLSAPGLCHWQGRSHGLFKLGASMEHHAPPPVELIDRFTARLGAEACHSIETEDDHRPERAWVRAAPGLEDRKAPSPRGTPRDQGARKDRRARPSRRPLWLLEHPRPVPRGELTLLSGPERIETGWWDQPNRRRSSRLVQRRCRDYYIAHRTTPGGKSMQCWVYALRGSWFIHGYFS